MGHTVLVGGDENCLSLIWKTSSERCLRDEGVDGENIARDMHETGCTGASWIVETWAYNV